MPWAAGTPSPGGGPLPARLACGLVSLTAVPIWALTIESFAGADLAVTTPRGLWVAMYFYTFLGLFMIAAAIAHRRPPRD